MPLRFVGWYAAMTEGCEHTDWAKRQRRDGRSDCPVGEAHKQG
jgi:hypothetical protein